MAIASPYPTYVEWKTLSDGSIRWKAQWRATNYTIAMNCLVDNELSALLNAGLPEIRVIVGQHATALANERSGVLIAQGATYLDTWESSDTQDTYQIYGPFDLYRSLSVGNTILWIQDLYSEWSGNVLTVLTVWGKTTPASDSSSIAVEVPQPVEVKKIDVWPWSR